MFKEFPQDQALAPGDRKQEITVSDLSETAGAALKGWLKEIFRLPRRC